MSFQTLKQKLSARITDSSQVSLSEIDSIIQDLLTQGRGGEFSGFSELLEPKESDLFFSRADFVSQAVKEGNKVVVPFLIHLMDAPKPGYGVIRLPEEAMEAANALLKDTFLGKEEVFLYPMAIPLAYLSVLSFTEVYHISHKIIAQRQHDMSIPPLDWLKFLEIPPLKTLPGISDGEMHPYAIIGVASSSRRKLLGGQEWLRHEPFSASGPLKGALPLCVGAGLADSLDFGTFAYKKHVVTMALHEVAPQIPFEECTLDVSILESEVIFEVFCDGEYILSFDWQRSYFENEDLMETLAEMLCEEFKFKTLILKKKEKEPQNEDILPVSAEILPFPKTIRRVK